MATICGLRPAVALTFSVLGPIITDGLRFYRPWLLQEVCQTSVSQTSTSTDMLSLMNNCKLRSEVHKSHSPIG